ncbi:MoaD/ThiS family protein [Fimbriimonas ginsengisoli]|uniref:Thiamine S protein n=1 Tax=Fimbriimonas ginsengisoli Gsoil 348 TaxID=661478 RepID=A0A068NWI3_FIMGI|nr:MoaD/ThiS family protein [Fimbriimonas ginsengisoli]AIE85959.1 thiamine S protein [Fimbriimonas ginsengisoli Gsoil 348]
MKSVSVLYFAALRERRGLDRETVLTAAETPAAFYAELADRHALNMDASLVRFALDGEFVKPNTLLPESSELALIPPVAGG